jgi:hypothetical protein
MKRKQQLTFTLAEAGRMLRRRDSQGVYRPYTLEEMESLAASGLLTTYRQWGETRTTLLDLQEFAIGFGRRVVTQKGKP